VGFVSFSYNNRDKLKTLYLMKRPEINIGIGMSSKQLDIYARPQGHFFGLEAKNQVIIQEVNKLLKNISLYSEEILVNRWNALLRFF
jgi:hypothetical protein